MNTTSNAPAWVLYLIGAGFVALVGLILWSRKKQKDSAWEGVLTDKNSSQNYVSNPNQNTDNQPGITILGGSNQAVQTSYTLEVKTDSGQMVNIGVGQGIYEQAQVGDRYRKVAGQMEPEKIASDTSAPAPAVTSQTPSPPDQTIN